MFSLPKLLLLILLLVVGWFVWRAIKRRGVSGIFGGAGAAKATRSSTPPALEMEKCRICGDFVSADARACAQSRCPYPAA